VQACKDRGLDVDEFAPRFSFFFNAHNDFFEEIAKFRAARKIWAYVMRDRFGAKNPRSHQLRFHTQTSGVSLTWQQEENNVVRAALQAFAAIFGGTQSLHVDAKDEQYSLPSEPAALLALRTQQVIAHETGVTDVVDPFAGSYFMEALTRDMEEAALTEIEKIDKMGGMIQAVKRRYPKLEIERSALEYSRRVERGEEKIVGVNIFVNEDEKPKPVQFRGNPKAERVQKERLAKFRAKRDNSRVGQTLKILEQGAKNNDNLMPSMVEAVKAGATLGEVVIVLKSVYGEYIEG